MPRDEGRYSGKYQDCKKMRMISTYNFILGLACKDSH